MAKQVKQIRYYNDSDTLGKNQPKGLKTRFLISGSAFSEYVPIVQLGIQSLPGTKFYLNNSINPIIIGQTGIYELNLEGLSEITALSFDRESVAAINRNNNAYLIVDLIYEDGEG